MKERPVIFNSEMVKATLDGRKTQFRRVVKPQPVYQGHKMFIVECERDKWAFESGVNGSIKTPIDHSEVKEKAPYQVGDKLWVRETFQALEYVPCTGLYDEYEGSLVEADWMGREAKDICDIFYNADEENEAIDKWRPSVNMPQWASRLFLEITDVRVERLQDIRGVDARESGVADCDIPDHNDCFYGASLQGYKCSFEHFWDSINKKSCYSWDMNPWVWVIEFKENKK